MFILLCSNLSSFPTILLFPFCPSGFSPLCMSQIFPLSFVLYLLPHEAFHPRQKDENFKKLTKLRRLRKLVKFTRLKKLKSYKVHKVPPSKKAVCWDDCKLSWEFQRCRFCESHHIRRTFQWRSCFRVLHAHAHNPNKLSFTKADWIGAVPSGCHGILSRVNRFIQSHKHTPFPLFLLV